MDGWDMPHCLAVSPHPAQVFLDFLVEMALHTGVNLAIWSQIFDAVGSR